MNPALTTAVFISNRDWKSAKYALMTMSGQAVGGFVGMQLGHLLRAQKMISAQNPVLNVTPPYQANIPRAVINGNPEKTVNIAFVILATEMCFTLVYTTTYLCARYAYHKA